MVNRSGLLEKEGAAFAADKSNVRKTPNLSHTVGTNTKRPEIDQLLEDTLISIKPGKSLTRREMKILKLIVAGNTNKKIAQKLYRTERTVEYHRHGLMRKLNAKTAADLAKRAIIMRLV